MIRVAVIYNKADNSNFDYDYYVKTHMPLAANQFQPTKWEVDNVLKTGDGSVSPIHCVGYLYFNSLEHLETAMTDEAVGRVMADIPNYYSGGTPVILISEVFS